MLLIIYRFSRINSLMQYIRCKRGIVDITDWCKVSCADDKTGLSHRPIANQNTLHLPGRALLGIVHSHHRLPLGHQVRVMVHHSVRRHCKAIDTVATTTTTTTTTRRVATTTKAAEEVKSPHSKLSTAGSNLLTPAGGSMTGYVSPPEVK